MKAAFAITSRQASQLLQENGSGTPAFRNESNRLL